MPRIHLLSQLITAVRGCRNHQGNVGTFPFKGFNQWPDDLEFPNADRMKPNHRLLMNNGLVDVPRTRWNLDHPQKLRPPAASIPSLRHASPHDPRGDRDQENRIDQIQQDGHDLGLMVRIRSSRSIIWNRSSGIAAEKSDLISRFLISRFRSDSDCKRYYPKHGRGSRNQSTIEMS